MNADFTTMEKLQCLVSAQYGAVLKYKDWVIAVDYSWACNFKVNVYEFIDEPNEDLGEIECRLNPIWEASDFDDNGSAVKAAFDYINKEFKK